MALARLVMEISRDNLAATECPFFKTSKHYASHPPDTSSQSGRSPTIRDSAPPVSSSELSRRLRRPLPRHGKIPSSSVMPCTFDMDDVLLYVKENFRNRIALPFSAAFSCRLNRTGPKGINRSCPQNRNNPDAEKRFLE
jgi:hypothetical protein